VGCVVVVAGCGLIGGSSSSTTTTAVTAAPTIPTTTTTVPQASLEVRPPAGPIGTSFQLLVTRFQPAEMVIFEIDFPDGKVFKGKAHKVAADGTVTAPYSTTGNPAGTYQVKATGDKGDTAAGQFDVTGSTTGSTTASTAVGHTTTTGHATTTGHTTTTKKP
jgi:hypothetical protein